MRSFFCILLSFICVLCVSSEENESDGLVVEVNKTGNLPQAVGMVNNSTDSGSTFGLNRKSKKQRAKGKKRSSKGKKSRKSKDGDSCKDKVETCDRAKNHCNDAKLQETLKKNCAKTCGFCKDGNEKKESGGKKQGGTNNAKEGGQDDGKQNDGECADESSTCSQWDKNGFCKSEYYTEEEKREKCAKTCNLCKNDGGKDDGEEGTEDDQKEGKENNEAEEKPKSGNRTKKSGKAKAGNKKTRSQKSKKQNKKGVKAKSKKNSKRTNGKKKNRG
ncbi:hypothetical protein M3Y96_00553400 [Aphelenchoides besseyi]|nr:hypothetical protein M3Y96_00553400 [Aphelenchoides besseyi]